MEDINEYLDELHHNRDYYSSAKIIELIRAKLNYTTENKGWTPMPNDKDDDWGGYNKAANNNCWIKFDDGSICRFESEDWPFAVTTHYKLANDECKMNVNSKILSGLK